MKRPLIYFACKIKICITKALFSLGINHEQIFPIEEVPQQAFHTCQQLGGEPLLPESTEHLIQIFETLDKLSFSAMCRNTIWSPIQRSLTNMSQWVSAMVSI